VRERFIVSEIVDKFNLVSLAGVDRCQSRPVRIDRHVDLDGFEFLADR
jgi:hypothetical protein